MRRLRMSTASAASMTRRTCSILWTQRGHLWATRLYSSQQTPPMSSPWGASTEMTSSRVSIFVLQTQIFHPLHTTCRTFYFCCPHESWCRVRSGRCFIELLEQTHPECCKFQDLYISACHLNAVNHGMRFDFWLIDSYGCYTWRCYKQRTYCCVL